MSNYNELPVYKASYDLTLAIFQLVKNFTKDYKYTVGESLKKETMELILNIYRANRQTDKRRTIDQAREHIEVIRLLIRLMKDMHQLSLKAFIHVNDKIEMVSKQLVGWQKVKNA